ncbi:SBBP repeat-containing protein [Fluviicola sp.]|uniref:SBBP repeat-containing protein n=1 Tax=Fluviicola sp. TaxID=1917219 RepID=UPI0026346D5B|nr:SBBP repeat-containing protein [Fluviicola sp.]
MKKSLLPRYTKGFHHIIFFSSLFSFQMGYAQSPQFEWGKKIGGTEWDQGNAIAVDNAGNVYTTGQFKQTVDFDPGAADLFLTSAGDQDIFVCKLDSQGNLVWAKKMGGTGEDIGKGIQVDPNGNVYVTGKFKDVVDFDPNAGIINLTSAGMSDVFVAKLDESGNLLWVKQFGGSEDDYSFAISLDAHNNVYTTGSFSSVSDFTSGNFLTTFGGHDIFINKLTTSGNYVWTKQFGGDSYDEGTSLFVSGGNVYATGFFQNTADLDPGGNTQNFTSPGLNIPDIFVSKIDTSGNFVWAKQIGSTGNDYGYGISVDLYGDVYLTGRFENTVDFDPNAGTYNLTAAGTFDFFVMKFTSSGNLAWAKQFGNNGMEISYGIMNDMVGNVYTTGYFDGIVDFDPGNGTFNLEFTQSESDCFISQLSKDGDFVWAGIIAGSKFTSGLAIAPDNSGSVYTTGWFGGQLDADPSAGNFSLSGSGMRDVFIQKMSSSVGILENDALNSIMLYPNPVSNTMTLQSTITLKEFKIVGMLGEVVQLGTINSNTLHLDLLKTGNYILEVLDVNNQIHHKHFVKN